MTYQSREDSDFGGEPINLFLFQHGSQEWTYTSSDENYTYNARVYIPENIEDDEIKQTTERPRDSIEITVPRNFPVAQLFIAQAPDGTVYLTVYREHRGEQDFIQLGKWRLLGVTWRGSEAVFTAEPLFTSLGRRLMRQWFTPTCRYAVFSPECGASPVPFTHPATVQEVNGVVLKSPDFAALGSGYLVNGTIIMSGVARRRIVYHQNDTIHIMAPILEVQPGHLLFVRRGCNKLIDGDCQNVFNNDDNHGGFPDIPDERLYQKEIS